MTLKKLICLCSLPCATLLLPNLPLSAEQVSQARPEPVLDHAWRAYEYPPGYFQANGDNPRIYQEVDILHYTIDATFILGASYPDTGALEAVTTIDGQAKAETLTELIIDFYDNITINSFKLNDIEFSNYTRTDNKIWMNLSADPLAPSEVFEITVDYERVYGSAYQGIMFRSHGVSDTPAICSIDQPYRSPRWWPCFDYPSDKATADIYMTYPDWMIAVSNGTLQSEVNNGDGTITAHWNEGYQAYTSALSVAMTDYTTWTDTYVSPLDGTTTMPLVYYAFPEDAAKAMVDYDVTADAIVYFAQIFGEYPFIDEKYGIAETPNSFGSLEHQTITSLTYRATQSAVNWDVIVHELAHQWWGDWVTCETWNHLWLHEGLATYGEVLFHEYDTGEPAGAFMAVNYDDGLYAGSLGGTVYTEDEHLFNPFTETGAVYEKGGWVVHMLRYLIANDTTFFNALKTFGANHAHSTAVTDDIKGVMEAAYGSPLDDFFDQWVYTPVQDLSGTPLRDYYTMPVVFTVHYTDATTETFTVNNDQRDQTFQLLTIKEPDYTVLDEGSDILKVVTTVAADNDGIPGDGDNNGIPGDNPCTGGLSEDCDDNCPLTPNGPDLGTCTAGVSYTMGRPCLSDGECGDGGFCSMGQEDSNGDGIGDACYLCEADFDCNGNVDAADVTSFLNDFGRSTYFNPCTNADPCNGDFDCNVNVDANDVSKFLEDFGRSQYNNPCPACEEGVWCLY
jgi:hypothetical protein